MPARVRVLPAGNPEHPKIRFVYDPIVGDSLDEQVRFEAETPAEVIPTFSELLVTLQMAGVSLYRCDIGVPRKDREVKKRINPFTNQPLPYGIQADRTPSKGGWAITYGLGGAGAAFVGYASNGETFDKLVAAAQRKRDAAIAQRRELFAMSYKEALQVYLECPPLRTVAVNDDEIG
jgi:hypothetical protein